MSSRLTIVSKKHLTLKPWSAQSPTLFQVSDYITKVVWSPNGEYLAACSAGGDLYLWSATPRHVSSEPLRLRPPQENSAITTVAFSCNSAFLAATGQAGEVYLWSLAESSASPLPPLALNASSWIDQLSWSPCSLHLAFSIGSVISVWDFQPPEPTLVAQLDFEASSVLNLAWHPQGKELAISGHGGVKVWETSTWTSNPYLLQVPGASISAAWSGDGTYLASGNLDRTLSVLAWENPPPWLMQGFPGKVREVLWVPQNVTPKRLLAVACAEGVILWEKPPQDNASWQNWILNGHRGTVRALAFHPQELLLTSAGDDGQVYLWHKACQQCQVLTGNAAITDLVWHPQGEMLIAGTESGELLLWVRSAQGKGFY
ncbi:MAG: WD40 repeat domain-containing protein [Prochlorotrichaceae cyanobacterium]